MLSHALTFSPASDDSFFQEVPTCSAVFGLRGDGDPYISKTANLRRRLQRLLGPPTELSKRLNLRERVREVEYTLTSSDFEAQLLLYRVLRANFLKTYSARLRLRPAPLVKLHLENQYPRASVTTRLSARGKNLFYGPFPSRVAAEKFSIDALDFFKMRRCVDDLHPDPAFPGCVYSEMKMCLAPCFEGCTDAEYHAEVSRVREFFDTAGDSLLRELADQREHASAQLAFEDAAAIHARVEKLKPLLAQLPEIVHRIDRLDAMILQPSAESNSVCFFRFRDCQFHGPLTFNLELGATPPIEPKGGVPSRVKPRTMESRVEDAIAAFPQPEAIPALQCIELLAILKRWFYRSQRVGEIFFADANGSWPLRRIVRGIGRVLHGEPRAEKDQPPSEFSATQSNIGTS
jgi:excinuclease ABC subunit C